MKKIKYFAFSLIIMFALFLAQIIIADVNNKYVLHEKSNFFLAEDGGGVIYPPPKTMPELPDNNIYYKSLV